MNKYRQRLISFASAAAIAMTILPLQALSADSTGNGSYYYAFKGDEKWETTGSNVNVTQTGTSVTVKETGDGNLGDGSAYIALPEVLPTDGKISFSFTYTCSVGESDTRSSFSLVHTKPTDDFKFETTRDVGFGVGKYGSEMRVPFNGDNNEYCSSYTTETTYKISATVDYTAKTVSYTITDANGNSLINSDGYINEYLSMTNEKIEDKNIDNFNFQYLNFYVRKDATITVSDFVISSEGAAPPTAEPTDAPSATATPGISDPTVIYDLDTDTRTDRGWTTEAPSGTAGGGSVQYSDGKLTLSNTNKGDRAQTVEFKNTGDMAQQVKIDITLTMTADKDGEIGSTDGAYTHFKLTDKNDSDVLDLMLGNDGIGDRNTTLYLNGDDTGITSENGSVTVKVIAIADYENDTLYVTLMQNGKAVYSANLPMTAAELANAVSILHRGDQDNVDPRPQTVVDELKLQNVTSPLIFVAGTGGTIAADGVVNFEIEVGETVSLALLRNYDTNSVTITANNGDTNALSNTTHIENDFAEAEYVPTYNAITARGKSKGELETFTVSITGNDGQEKTERQFHITVVDAQPESMPSVEPLSTITPEPILSIDFEDNGDNKYTISDEYGETLANMGMTSVDNTSGGLIYDYSTSESPQPVRTDNPANSGISGKAFYSFLNTDKIHQYAGDDSTKNLAGNGYRGSKLTLDNSLIQRTDKINVSYDFAIYNIVNDDSGSLVGMPVSVSMTSEAIDTGSIPFDFNAEHCFEIDADPSNTEEISKHLLTFFTGRPKRDITNGVHWVDMTNKLAYFDPLYKTESNPYGQYRELTAIGQLSEGYNFFHVDAEVDFYNNVINFTVSKNGEGTTKTQTITTTIPEHSSWNGFIIASNKWDKGDATDTDGMDTEHYVYLDNIKAEKIAVDDKLIDPSPVPTARPLPTDAVSFENANGSSTGKEVTTTDTWAHYGAYTELQSTAEPGYVEYSSETESKDFTHRIANDGENDRRITSYTEFDFYLPKRGSYITLNLIGTKGSQSNPGNTITISTAGISSWTNMETYTRIYDELDCGKWYSMQLEYDFLDSVMRVRVFDGDEEIADSVVGTRTLNDNYYRQLCFNPASITTVGANETDSLPVREPSMALTYIANLRIYNRATVKEYYPEGTIADSSTGDASNGETPANNTRIGSLATDFTADQVNDDTPSTKSKSVLVGTLDPPKSSSGKTFSGWKLIYSNGENSNIGNGNEGTNATRLKYVPEYSDLPVDSVVSGSQNGYYYKTFWTDIPIIAGNNFKTIDWYVYNNNEFRMWGNFDLTKLPQLSGNGEYRIGYVVYNIPVSDENIIALPQAHHEVMTEEEKSAPTATPLPDGSDNPGPTSTPMPQPSGAPVPSGTPGPDAN